MNDSSEGENEQSTLSHTHTHKPVKKLANEKFLWLASPRLCWSTTCVGRNSFDNQITYSVENRFICCAHGFGALVGYFNIETYPTIAVVGIGSEFMFYSI